MSSRLPVAALVLLALILVPFFLWEDAILRWANAFTGTPGNAAFVAAAIGGLLAADIVLPVPSSLVSTAAGALLGFLPGALVSWLGMTAGSLVGYALGQRASAGRWLPDSDRARLERARTRFGDWIVILFRPVPVLAEASAVFAGVAAMPWSRFLLLAALSNLGISLVYAATGAFAASRESFLAAFAGAIVLPGLAVIILKRIGR